MKVYTLTMQFYPDPKDNDEFVAEELFEIFCSMLKDGSYEISVVEIEE